jgi:hypothetical protein
MIIDVLLNSVARPKLLDTSFKSFLKHIKTTKHEFRFVIVENKVDNKDRQVLGKEWIEKHKEHFDVIVYQAKAVDIHHIFQDILKYAKSPYFFRLEDDAIFTYDIDIDPLIEILEQNQDICEITFRRKIHKAHSCGKKEINEVSLECTDFYSLSIGLMNLELTKKIIDKCGWDNPLHEASVLTPVTKKLGYKKYLLGSKKWFWQALPVHYVHNEEYKKGAYKI